jgi:CBS domain containing-hemolysin-like protein
MELPRMLEREDGVLIVDGSVPMGELPVDRMSIQVDLGSKTIGGFMVESLGRLARPGDVVRFGAFDAVVEDVRQRRVARVALHPRTPSLPPEQPEAEGESAEDESEA